jgi:hypothetical protein
VLGSAGLEGAGDAFVAYLFAWVHSILLLWWIDKENDTDPKTMAKYLERWAFAYWRKVDRDKFA